MKVLSVVGNRPQFVKSAPLSVALRDAGVDEVVVHTGQHYDRELSAVFFDELGLAEPAYRLEAHTRDIETMQPGIAAAIVAERPDVVVVFGDTNSTLAGARAAREAGVALAHVEAGMRSGDMTMPEEHNRIEVDSLADLLLCPDERSRAILDGEGVAGRKEVVGDVMRDALDTFLPIAQRRPAPRATATTCSRRSTATRTSSCRGSGRFSTGWHASRNPWSFPPIPELALQLRNRDCPWDMSVWCEPFGYLDMLALASRARVIVTDSGGLQKEAYWLGVPCVTARPSTEWVDTIEQEANTLVDADPDRLVAAVAAARPLAEDRAVLYGDGHAAGRIAEALCTLFGR